MQSRVVLLIVLLIGLMGCTESVDIQLEPEVRMYFSDKPAQPIVINDKDEVYVSLNTWLNENKSDWYATSGRYPGGVYVKSGDRGIQVTQTKVIIYSTTTKEPRAIYIHDLKRGELSEIVKLAK